MLDINFIRENQAEVEAAAKNKNVDVDIAELLRLDEERRTLRAALDELNAERNALAKDAAGRKPSDEAISRGKELKEKILALETRLAEIHAPYDLLLHSVPNVPSVDTPVGSDETKNKILGTCGDAPEFSFEPKAHWDLGESLGIIDNERAAKVSGSRFTFLTGAAAMLELALIHFAFDVLTSETKIGEIIESAGLQVPVKAFIPVIPPTIVRQETMKRMARFDPPDDRYLLDDDQQVLIGSAEHSLGALHMDEVLGIADLPLRYVGYSPAFRREAGSHGKDVRGILRMHEFHKVEMEVFSSAEHGMAEHELLIAVQEYLMMQLELPYRVVLKCTGDMGAPNARGVDIETWMAGQNTYRETHSADYMSDYQARRLKTKYKTDSGNEFAHMNDATALAIGRTIIAILENNQQEDGSVVVPAVLRHYMPHERIA